MKPSTGNHYEPRGSVRPLKRPLGRAKNALFIMGIAASLAMTSCAVDGYVESQPTEVVYTRPVAPGPGYVWIDGDWAWSGGRYAWRNGYWGRPRGGRAWQGGHWDRGPRGYHWSRGHWR